MANCDNCGGHLQQNDDDSFSCPYCGENYEPIDEEDEDEG
jgi:predicted RNA-binding Zn-ribbon protein involved in translation (DUF1610 family)